MLSEFQPTKDYSELSPEAQLAAQVYGVAYPFEMSKHLVASLLRRAQVQLKGRWAGVETVRRANRELLDAGLVVRTRGHDVVACADRCLEFTLAAQQSGHLLPLAQHFERPRQYVYASIATWKQTQLRWCVGAGQLQWIDELEIDHSRHWSFLGHPFGIPLLERIPAKHREQAIAGALGGIIDSLHAPEAALAACHALTADLAQHAAELAFIHILKGQLDDACALFDELPSAALQRKPASTALPSVHALVATLRGDDEAASRGIEAALAAERVGTRKRNLFPPHRAFPLALLAWVRSNDLAPRGELDRLLRIGESLSEHQNLRTLVLAARASRLRKHSGHIGWDGRHAINQLCIALSDTWRREDALYGRDPEALLTLADQAAANGYLWVEAECCAATHRQPEDFGDAAAERAGRQSDALHRQMGSVSLCTAGEPLPAWEYSLKALEDLAAKAREAGGAASGQRRRLVWSLEGLDDGGPPTIVPREQRLGKAGNWSKGRVVPLWRLHHSAEGLDCLTEQDHAAIEAFEPGDYWARTEYEIGWGTLHALAGHPHLVRDSVPVQVMCREPELIIDEAADGGARVRMRPHIEDAETGYLGQMLSPTRYEVWKFSDSHRQLQGIIPPEGLSLPTGARARFFEAVSALAGDLRVQSADGEDASAPQVEADPGAWLRLEPNGDGLTVDMLVEPVAESAIYLTPGVGGTTVFAVQDNATVQAQRDLAAERAAAQELIDACPMLRGIDAGQFGDWRLALAEPEDCLALLEQLSAAGARCLWPKGEPFKIIARAGSAALNLSIKRAADWFSASGEVRFDEREALSLSQIFALLDENPGSRFLKMGEDGFLALSSAFRRQLEDLRSLSSPAAGDALRMHPLATLALDELIADAQVNTDAAWREQRRRLDEAQAFDPALPSTLQADLRPYQREGYEWLARLSQWGAGACLADDMGLGKTVQTLALLLNRAPDGPALVVAPTSVVANWIDEANRFAPTLNVALYGGTASSRDGQLGGLGPFDLVVTSYGLLQNDIGKLAEVPWRSAVLDEAQAIKNPATKRAKATRLLKADFRLITTGTPIQNNLIDLHSLFSFINPGLLGSLEHYRRHFAAPIERNGNADARSRLRRLIAPFMLRRLKADVLDDLPERTEITLHVEMSPKEAALYEALRQRAVEDLQAAPNGGQGKGARRLEVLAHLTRLRLACCNPKLVREAGAPESSKLKMFRQMIDELRENRHKVLVFSQFVTHLKLLEEAVREAGIPYQYLDGSTPAKTRAERVAAFQAGEGDLFLISLKAGGTGLNLTAADYVIHMDPWWNPAVEDQASDRAHRIGQIRPVTIYRLVAKGTIEDQIVELHRHKKDLADRLLQDADAPARLNAEELLELLRQPMT
ncbi:MAG: DEAD/DEAH box helicase [Gammaproteobacteria bacterium]|nr:DEAD/DEAH box helicase [Gammaproteobacteria bacterium]